MSDGSHTVSKPGSALVIDGTQMHYSEEFTGMRFSVVAFLHNSTKEMCMRDRHRLTELGFIFPNMDLGASPSIRPPNHFFPPPTQHRTLVEFCCEPNSMLGRRCPPECRVIRMTETENMASDQGAALALSSVRQAPRGRVFLWSSIPCTGGSQWNVHNLQVRPFQMLSKMQAH